MSTLGSSICHQRPTTKLNRIYIIFSLEVSTRGSLLKEPVRYHIYNCVKCSKPSAQLTIIWAFSLSEWLSIQTRQIEYRISIHSSNVRFHSVKRKCRKTDKSSPWLNLHTQTFCLISLTICLSIGLSSTQCDNRYKWAIMMCRKVYIAMHTPARTGFRTD